MAHLNCGSRPVDIALHNAFTEKGKIEGEIAGLRERLRRVETFIAMYGEFSGAKPLPMPPAMPSLADVFASKRQSIPDAVASMLADGFAMTTAEILEKLDSMGIIVGGDEPSKRTTNLSSSLSRDSRFLNTRGQGWSLRPTQKVESPASVGADAGLEDLV